MSDEPITLHATDESWTAAALAALVDGREHAGVAFTAEFRDAQGEFWLMLTLPDGTTTRFTVGVSPLDNPPPPPPPPSKYCNHFQSNAKEGCDQCTCGNCDTVTDPEDIAANGGLCNICEQEDVDS